MGKVDVFNSLLSTYRARIRGKVVFPLICLFVEHKCDRVMEDTKHALSIVNVSLELLPRNHSGLNAKA